MLDVPEGVVNLPHAIELFGLEETQQEGLGLHVGIEDEESHLHKVVVEECLVDDFLDDVGILEDHLHQTAVTRSRSDVGVVGLASFGGHIALAQHGVLEVHIVLRALGGLHGDVQLGINLGQFHEGIAHRYHAAGNDGATGTDIGGTLEHFWETLNHATGNLAVLLGSDVGQFAPAVLGIAHDGFHLLQHFLASRCELVDLLGLQHHIVGRFVARAVADVS